MSETRLGRPELPKRFYKAVAVVGAGDGFTLELDGRSLKTPSRRALAVPRQPIAEAIAVEWDAQGTHIDPGTMPVTRLANTIVDGIVDNPRPILDEVGRYIETDMLFYRAGEPERLVERQRLEWDPVLTWAHETLGHRFELTEGVMHVAQPSEALEAYRMRIAGLSDAFMVGAFQQIVSLTGSALLGLAVLEGRLSSQEAWRLAHLDEDWNIGQWGADEEARALREIRWHDMQAAMVMLTPAT
ncbi:Chaperone required for the assembly of the F1-ATPase [Fulvimarina manganoxydans]|uniref:Chaperone required for the assembly of the F1-ATPase n=1 Tax=Fulvimarina manganoxydans TaxID=937218 RepID=A0A1W2E1H3_9HYPH|nr:ATP12 family protein [Fulvimarina manganoxydans]SMD03701.1 Chaperone required for the assembly of the F1-ATPase [Fulvimarina manganoxydans]